MTDEKFFITDDEIILETLEVKLRVTQEKKLRAKPSKIKERKSNDI